MIYIEVRFGTINGNAITIDSALSSTSTNPVQNKVIDAALKALQLQITNIASQIPKEVVSVANEDALYEIEDPSTEVVYITEDTGDLYIYDGENFVESTGRLIDGTIYVTDIDELIDMELEAGKAYPVVCVTESESEETSESYTLDVSTNARTLISKDGYAVVNDNAWSWSNYSFVGHTHEISDINGLSDGLAAKQNATDNTLNTTSKTIVGAINELLTQMTLIIHAFVIDFQESREVVQMRNLKGAIKIKKIVTDNVATLKVKINGTTQTLTLTNGVCTQEISIADNALLVWEITRMNEGDIAEINVQYQYNS